MAVAPAPPPAAAAIGRKRTDTGRRRIGEKWYTPYLFILPHYLIFGLFVGIPFFLGIWISLHNWNPFGESPYVWLENFTDLFDPAGIYGETFFKTLWNTVLFVIMSTPLLVGAGLLIAVLLNSRLRGSRALRTIFFAPWTLGVATVSLIWWWIFTPIGGLANRPWEILGLQGPSWLTETPWAWIVILIATVWWTVGFNTVILLAGLQAIPVDLYEAAAIDGANGPQQFRHVTLPSLRPVLLLVLTLQIIASFQLVGQSQIITGGGPGNDTRPVLLYAYEVGFTGSFALGPAAAMYLIVAAIMLVVSIVNFRLFASERA